MERPAKIARTSGRRGLSPILYVDPREPDHDLLADHGYTFERHLGNGTYGDVRIRFENDVVGRHGTSLFNPTAVCCLCLCLCLCLCVCVCVSLCVFLLLDAGL